MDACNYPAEKPNLKVKSCAHWFVTTTPIAAGGYSLSYATADTMDQQPRSSLSLYAPVVPIGRQAMMVTHPAKPPRRRKVRGHRTQTLALTLC